MSACDGWGTNEGGDYMTAIDKLDYEKVIEIAQNMGYDPKKPEELNQYIDTISKMDLWDISKALFFGNNPSAKNKDFGLNDH